MDNVSAVERVGGDSRVAAHADRIREAGWAALRRDYDAKAGDSWPPVDAILGISLNAADEQFVAAQLADSERVTLEILAENLHADVRREQEQSLLAGRAASEVWRDISS